MRALAAGLLVSGLIVFSSCFEESTTTQAASVSTAAAQTAVADMRFGINGGMYPTLGAPEAEVHAMTRELDDLGLACLRHPGQGEAWHDMQPTRTTWDFDRLDAVLNNNAHPWVIELYGSNAAVYPFGGFSVSHLRTLPMRDAITYMASHTVDLADPQQLADAETYVRTFVGRYKDNVRYWEIGNEGIQTPGVLDRIVSGYPWIKAEDPEAVVLVTAVAGTRDNQFHDGLQAFDNMLAQGAGDFFDVANFHYYGEIDGDFEARLEQRYDEYKATLDRYGVSKPIWVTETSTSSDPHSVLSGASSEAIQAQHVVKRLVVFSAKGAEKVLWHGYRHTNAANTFYQCNLIDPDTDRRKPAYHTLKLVLDKIGHYVSVETLRRDTVRLYRFTNPDGSVVLVGWSKNGEQVSVQQVFATSNVTVTHIVEDASATSAAIETVAADQVLLSESPVFIE